MNASIALAFAVAAASTAARPASCLVLLSDLPTPSFVVDIPALRRRTGPPPAREERREGAPSGPAPSIRCPRNGLLLRPTTITRDEANCREFEGGDSMVVDCDFDAPEGTPAVGYLHSSVVRPRDDAATVPGEKSGPASDAFLAEIDLDPGLCGHGGARLVLGLNNHHVGGYYWARSAGAGASMEAPGVAFVDGGGTGEEKTRGVLRWTDEGGPAACNSNDGKRSEWANFLRRGDTVQLVPADGQETLRRFARRFGGTSAAGEEGDASSRVYGVSSEGRPLGSEPAVVCEWRAG